MAYADYLDPAIPASGEKRKFGDDDIRQLTRAVRQRLASIFADVDADPLSFKNLTIQGGALLDLAVLTAKIADLAVTTGKLADGAVTALKLAALAVATANIIDGAVTQAKLANLSVGTAQLIDANVTAAKLAAASVLPGAIGAGTFGFDGVSSTSGYRVGGAAPLGQVMKGDGAWGTFQALAAADFPDALLQKLIHYHTGWGLQNAIGSSASFMTKYGVLTGSMEEHSDIMTQAGEIRKLWIRGNADRTAGTFTVQIAKNTVNVGGAIATIDGANPRQVIAAFAAGAVPFAAGDYIGLTWQSAGLTPAGSTEYYSGFEARYT